jgi:hypothetical protein
MLRRADKALTYQLNAALPPTLRSRETNRWLRQFELREAVRLNIEDKKTMLVRLREVSPHVYTHLVVYAEMCGFKCLILNFQF